MPLPPLYCNGTNVVVNCRNASFHGHSYCKNCVSLDCLWFPSTVHTPSAFLLFTSKVTQLILFQSISCCSSQTLLSYWSSYLIVSCVLQHRIACLKVPAICCFCWSTASLGFSKSCYTVHQLSIWAVGNIMRWKKTWKSWNECCGWNLWNKQNKTTTHTPMWLCHSHKRNRTVFKKN